MRHPQLNCNGRLLDLSKPCVMGIINVTPDSFYSKSRKQSRDDIIRTGVEMAKEGAAIIDIGGESTRPGTTEPVSVEEELARVIPAITALYPEVDCPISIDTSQPEVMQQAVQAGVGFINDVRALRLDGAAAMASQCQVPVCLMHMQYCNGIAPVEETNPEEDMMTVILNFLQQRITDVIAVGIPRERIVVDPGFGGGAFGKTVSQNLNCLHRLFELQQLQLPILVGLSRKSFIGAVLDKPPEARLQASLIAAALGAYHGANIIRTHDVSATVEALQFIQAVRTA